MPKNHLKPQKAPKTWIIKRKNVRFITRPKPGAHEMSFSMPLNLIFKNILEKVKTNKELKQILHNKEVLVDEKIRKNIRYPAGLMDVIAIPKENKYYRLSINELNKICVVEIDKKESNVKLVKVAGKKLLKGGRLQLKTTDGRTMVVKKDEFKTGDSLLLSLPEQEIKQVLKLEKGAFVLLLKGKHVGKTGFVTEINNEVIKLKNSEIEFETNKHYAIVIGKDKSVIKLK